MKSKTKALYHHGNLREALVKAALGILNRDGFEGLTLRQCAKAAGVSPAAPTHHFKNLKGLLTAVATYGFEMLTADMMSAKNIRELAHIYYEFAKQNPDLYRTMFLPSLHRDDVAYDEASRKCIAVLARELKTEHPKKSNEELALLTFKTWAQAHGFVLLALSHRLDIVGGQKLSAKENQKLEEKFFDYIF